MRFLDFCRGNASAEYSTDLSVVIHWAPTKRVHTTVDTTIMGLGPQNHDKGGFWGPNSIIVVYVDPLGTKRPYVDFGVVSRYSPFYGLVPYLES